MLATIFECSNDNIIIRSDALIASGDIDEPQICGSTKIPDVLGRISLKQQRGTDCPSFLYSSPPRNTDRWIKESAYGHVSRTRTPENCL